MLSRSRTNPVQPQRQGCSNKGEGKVQTAWSDSWRITHEGNSPVKVQSEHGVAKGQANSQANQMPSVHQTANRWRSPSVGGQECSKGGNHGAHNPFLVDECSKGGNIASVKD